jgi:CheY-like chemotaxis protein
MSDIPSRRARILMVDDHVDTTTAMQRLLSRLGYEVKTADCVKSALQATDSESFDVVISDLGLPDGSGLDLMRELVARGKPGVKGIALSGFNRDEDVQQSLDAGFSEHISKPVNIERLQTLIERLMV